MCVSEDLREGADENAQCEWRKCELLDLRLVQLLQAAAESISQPCVVAFGRAPMCASLRGPMRSLSSPRVAIDRSDALTDGHCTAQHCAAGRVGASEPEGPAAPSSAVSPVAWEAKHAHAHAQADERHQADRLADHRNRNDHSTAPRL